jgi:beta-barrel assembly-enhancing protease
MKITLKVASSVTVFVLGFVLSASVAPAAGDPDQNQSQGQNQNQGQDQNQVQNQNQTPSQNQNLSPKNDVNEIGNRKVAHKSMISTEKEIAMGKQYATQIDHSAKIITDPVVNEYINRVAQNVARNSDLTIPLTVKVLDSPEINAFALPGGFLYVNSGLIMAADEEDQVAGVMAHEIAHVAARHWASQMTKMTLLQYAMIPMIFVPMSYPVYLGVAQAMNFGVPVAFMKFNRSAEAEADYLGLQYMYKAGYDPSSYPAFFGKIMDEERRSPGSVSSVFADHPPTPDRIIKCEQRFRRFSPRKTSTSCRPRSSTTSGAGCRRC